MEKHIYDEKNGLSYTLCGDYYLPDLVLNEEEPTYGKYGMLRKQFLKEHRPIRYQNLLLSGKLTAHLNQIDQEVTEQVEVLMKQMAEKQSVNENLKRQDQMRWVRLMNNIKVCAEEIVLTAGQDENGNTIGSTDNSGQKWIYDITATPKNNSAQGSKKITNKTPDAAGNVSARFYR